MADPTPPDPFAKRLAAILPRAWRLVALGLAAWLLRFAAERPEHAAWEATIAVEQARRYFAEAQRLGPRDPGRGWQPVFDASGTTLGQVLTTSPQTDELVGYSGPNNLLIALAPDGRVAGLELLGSGDTPAHVTEVRRNTNFWRAWPGWNPATETAPRVDAVAGSTLTSLGIAEAVERRLAGRGVSLRFPEPVGLEEVRDTFPEAASLDAVEAPVNGLRIRDGSGRLLGYAVRSSPQAETVRGHGGPTEVLALIDRDGETVRAVRLRRSYDTEDYVVRVREDGPFLKSLAGRNVSDWARLDFKQAGIEGVSGATETSYAAAEGLRRRFAAEVQPRAQSRTGRWGLAGRWKDGVLLGVILGSLFMAFGGGRGRKSVRRIWQGLLVGVFGLGLGDLLSVSLLAGWSRHGVAWETAPGLVLLVALALLVPWATERAWYCHHLCPHGVLQEWLARIRRWQVAVPERLNRWLVWGGPVLLGLAFLFALARVDLDLARIEPFDAWTLTPAAWVSGIVALMGLGASLLVPMAYCRFGCPTGALLAFLRHAGRGDRLGIRDAAAALLLITGTGLVLARTPPTSTHSSANASVPGVRPGGDVQVLAGRAFGTTWTVKLRPPVADPVALEAVLGGELERIEASLSHWRTNSATSQFNAASTTQALEMPGELVSLVARCQEISRATDGAFDITVAPLVRAWGFGPGESPPSPPDAAALEILRARVGWQRLGIDTNAMTLRKDHPGLQIDLGAILQGYAADRLSERLVAAGSTNHLIEVGGELLARGRWGVAIEEPGGAGRVLRRVTLQDAALATSGTYRTRRSDGGRARSHLIDPRTALPVDQGVVLASVVHRSCALADAWATAMLVLGGTNAEAFVRTAGIEVLTVEGLRQPWQVGTTRGFPAETPVE